MCKSLAEKIGAQLPVVAAGESDNTTGSLASRWEALGAFSQASRALRNGWRGGRGVQGRARALVAYSG